MPTNRKERKRRLNEMYAQQERAAEERDAKARRWRHVTAFADAWTSFSVILVATMQEHYNVVTDFIRRTTGSVLTQRETHEKIKHFVDEVSFQWHDHADGSHAGEWSQKMAELFPHALRASTNEILPAVAVTEDMFLAELADAIRVLKGLRLTVPVGPLRPDATRSGETRCGLGYGSS